MPEKLKIAIVDLTDCEGCELEILSLKEKLLDLLDFAEIVNWRLVAKNKDYKNLDAAIVEGSPISRDELLLLKNIRKNSKILIALGTCACTGNFPALLSEKQRKKHLSQIYRPSYPKNSLKPQPISNFVKVDFELKGCPPNPSEIEQVLASLIQRLTPEAKPYPVCFACKVRENKCLLLDGKSCLGPVTAAGCGAVCPSRGIPCFGCWGPVKDANIEAIKNRLKNIGLSNQEIKNWLATCWQETKEFKEFYKEEQ